MDKAKAVIKGHFGKNIFIVTLFVTLFDLTYGIYIVT